MREAVGTVVAFLVLCALSFVLIYAEFLLDVTKSHKAGG
jgi:hypothetical protein